MADRRQPMYMYILPTQESMYGLRFRLTITTGRCRQSAGITAILATIPMVTALHGGGIPWPITGILMEPGMGVIMPAR